MGTGSIEAVGHQSPFAGQGSRTSQGKAQPHQINDVFTMGIQRGEAAEVLHKLGN